MPLHMPTPFFFLHFPPPSIQSFPTSHVPPNLTNNHNHFLLFHSITLIDPSHHLRTSLQRNLSVTMFRSPNPHFSPLCKWATSFFHHLKAKFKKKRRKSFSLANGFDWLSTSFAAMEMSNQLKQVFKLIDANGDGKISTVELREVLICLGHDKSEAKVEAEGMVKEMDCNGDGLIDLEEFMGVVGERNRQGQGEGCGCGSKDDDLMDAFLMFDADRNGFISAKELQTVLLSLGHDKCSLQDCVLMIRGVDRNGDGLIDFEEFRSMMTTARA